MRIDLFVEGRVVVVLANCCDLSVVFLFGIRLVVVVSLGGGVFLVGRVVVVVLVSFGVDGIRLMVRVVCLVGLVVVAV